MKNELKEYVKKHNLSYSQVSRDIGISYQWARHLLQLDHSDHLFYRMKIENLCKIKEAYGIDMYPFIEEEWKRQKGSQA